MTRIWASRDSGGGGSRLEWPEPATPEHGDLDTGARSVFEWRMCKITPSSSCCLTPATQTTLAGSSAAALQNLVAAMRAPGFDQPVIEK
jgi:hypothetical protein